MTSTAPGGIPPQAFQAVTLLKLGGSLLTDKTGVEALRPETLARLAMEIVGGLAARAAGGSGATGVNDSDGRQGSGGSGGVESAGRTGAPHSRHAPHPPPLRLIVAHGSGSFGHVAAKRYGIAAGLRESTQRPGVSLTQERAAALHWHVVNALAAAGLCPFSLAPSSSVVAAAGQPAAMAIEPLLLALHAGLLPVLYGDVVLDREWGVSICSTERLFTLLARELPAHGVRIERVIWLGETDGVYGPDGRTLPRLDAATLATLEIGGAAGTDVTGGMLHRAETALALAAAGIPSLIANGTTPGLLAAALAGQPVVGTEVGAAASSQA
jgi:isopentenyl phosphate kinase